MSGFCEFCGIWHSASCFHPGRKILYEKDSQIAAIKEQVGYMRLEIAALKDKLEDWREHWRKVRELNEI